MIDQSPKEFIYHSGRNPHHLYETEEDIIKDFWINHEMDKGSFFHFYSPRAWYCYFWDKGGT